MAAVSGSGVKHYLSLGKNIINRHGRYIQLWDTTIQFKGIIEAVIKFPGILISHLNFLVHDFL